MTQKQQNRSIQERGHHHYRTKQTKYLSSADHKAVTIPHEACTQIRCNIPAQRWLSAYRPRLQAMIHNTLHSLKLPAELFGTHSLCIGSATAAAEARIPMKIIKAMGRWSSDCYHRYIHTPHEILRSLTSKLCAP